MGIGIFILEPIKLNKLLNHLDDVQLNFETVSHNNWPTMLVSTPVEDGLTYSDIILCGSTIFSDCTLSKFSPNSSACCLILALRFLRAVLLMSGSVATKPDGVLLVKNQQNLEWLANEIKQIENKNEK